MITIPGFNGNFLLCSKDNDLFLDLTFNPPGKKVEEKVLIPVRDHKALRIPKMKYKSYTWKLQEENDAQRAIMVKNNQEIFTNVSKKGEQDKKT